MVTFKTTWHYIQADVARRRLLEGKQKGLLALIAVLLKPGMVSVILYRLARYCLFNRLKVIAKLLFFAQYIYTKNEISPLAEIGPGFVIVEGGATGITQVVSIGENCTIWACTTLTLGAMDAFDVTKDKIIIGDHCVIGPGVRIMRPVNIANGTQIKSNAVVFFSVDKIGCSIAGIPAKRRAVNDYADIVKWNPLHGGLIDERTK